MLYTENATGLDVSFAYVRGDASYARLPFPSGTHGFFYFVPGPAHAPIAGEVRFRVTASEDPATFVAGHDLLLPNVPSTWHIPLLNIARSKRSFKHLCDVLADRDRSVSTELIRTIRETKPPLVAYHTTRIIHSLKQPFVLDVSNAASRFCIASRATSLVSVELLWMEDYRKPPARETFTGATPASGTSRHYCSPRLT